MRDEFVSIDVPPWAWVALIGVIVVLLMADLLIVHRRPHAIGFREAAIESSVWIALGLSFTVVVGVAFRELIGEAGLSGERADQPIYGVGQDCDTCHSSCSQRTLLSVPPT